MNRFDGNCFVGNWPFYRVNEKTVEGLLNVHKRYGFTGGFLSSLEAVFYQDPFEAESQLAIEIKGTPYRHIMVLNPMLPAWKDDLDRGVEKLGVAGVRLMPGFHGYTLDDFVLDEVIEQVKKYNLYLLITLRMHDDRMTWMYHPRSIPMEEICRFVNRNHDVRILLNHIGSHEIKQMNTLGVIWDNLFVDTYGFKGGVNPVESVV